MCYELFQMWPLKPTFHAKITKNRLAVNMRCVLGPTDTRTPLVTPAPSPTNILMIMKYFYMHL